MESNAAAALALVHELILQANTFRLEEVDDLLDVETLHVQGADELLGRELPLECHNRVRKTYHLVLAHLGVGVNGVNKVHQINGTVNNVIVLVLQIVQIGTKRGAHGSVGVAAHIVADVADSSLLRKVSGELSVIGVGVAEHVEGELLIEKRRIHVDVHAVIHRLIAFEPTLIHKVLVLHTGFITTSQEGTEPPRIRDAANLLRKGSSNERKKDN